MSLEVVRSVFSDARRHLDKVLNDQQLLQQIADAGDLLASSFKEGKRLYSCGNGGSMCDAMHLAEELTGRYRKNRAPLPAIAISDPSHISCVANDYGYQDVFSRFIDAHGNPGDVLIAISTSGTSKNVVAAARMAKERMMKVIALTGKPGGPLAELASLEICTPGGEFADRVQELHIKVIHTLIELVERKLFPQNYL
jgi:D-sedoheptulose 7-phosphate isomerase